MLNPYLGVPFCCTLPSWAQRRLLPDPLKYMLLWSGDLGTHMPPPVSLPLHTQVPGVEMAESQVGGHSSHPLPLSHIGFYLNKSY